VRLALAAVLSGTRIAHAKTQNENYISYLGAAWGPDGDTIYFLKQTRGSGIWLCKMGWDGSQKQEISQLWPGQDVSIDTQSGPIWMEVNAATSNAVFGVEYGMGTVGIWVVGIDGKNLHRPFEPVWNDKEKERVLHPSWSPDGSQIVYGKDSRQLGIFDFKTKKRTQLTDGPHDEHPTWSPKGDCITFTHNLYDNGDKKYSDRRIWLIRPDGSEQKPVVDEKGQAIFGWWPSWSPDGSNVGITRDLLFLADLVSHKVEYIDPFPILGERLPYTFMGHHWGKRGWLLNNRGGIVFIDKNSRKARLLAANGIYGGTVASGRPKGSEQWGIAPVDLKGEER
jgi:hypothetical protein